MACRWLAWLVLSVCCLQPCASISLSLLNLFLLLSHNHSFSLSIRSAHSRAQTIDHFFFFGYPFWLSPCIWVSCSSLCQPVSSLAIPLFQFSSDYRSSFRLAIPLLPSIYPPHSIWLSHTRVWLYFFPAAWLQSSR